MKIALLHSYYRSESPSGENVVVDKQARVLSAAGHDVRVIARHSDEVAARASDKARLAWQVASGAGPDPTTELRSFTPDLVHVHNLFPNFGTRWLRHWKGPLVATVHNYRPLCANALLLREGKFCTLCPDGDRWAGVKHSCYRGSRLATIPLAIRNRSGATNDSLLQRADRIIALSPQAERLYTKYGISSEKLRLLPHGLDPAPAPNAAHEATRWISVGRLSPEKGWQWLVDNWPDDVQLDIVGTGPMLAELRHSAPANVRLLGAMDNDEVRRQLPTYRGAVFAGTTPEGAYPLTAVEALAAGLPLLAREGGAVAAMVDHWGCGSTFRNANDLRAQAHQPIADSDRQDAVDIFRQNFTTEIWLSGLLSIYQELVAQ